MFVPEWTLHEKIAWAFNLVLTGFLVWGVFLALKTLNAIKRQAEWMKRQTIAVVANAKAAQLNAQAVINAERARILFETAKRLDDERLRGVATFTVFAVNRGTVPAEVISYGKKEICKTPTNTLASEPRYQLADPPTVRFVPSGERHPVAEFQPRMPGNTRRLLKDVEGPLPENIADMHLTVYGEVIYKDGISEEIRHSRYCFEWFYTPGVSGGNLRPAGPAKYNECT
jgi:hypothetical protein